MSVPIRRCPTPGNSGRSARHSPHAPNHGISRWTSLIRRVEGEIEVREGARQVGNVAPAESERRGLPDDRQGVSPVDHPMALSRSALPSAVSEK